MADRSVNVKLRADISDYIAKMRGASAATKDAEKSARDLRKALDDEEAAAGRLKVAQARLADVQADNNAKFSQAVAAEEEVSRAQRQHEASTERVTQANKRYAESQRKVEEENRRGGKRTEDSMGRLAARANAQFDALKFTGLSLGLPAAAAVGAAGVTLALAAVATGFAALGVYAASGSEKVQAEFQGLSNVVMNDVTQMGALVEDEVVGALENVGQAWGRLSPQVAAAVGASAPAVEELAGAVTDLAEGAMPGLVTAAKESQPALEGVRVFAGQAGAGLGEFFTNASKGAEGAKQGFTVFGGTVQLLEARLGTLFANLANGSTGPLHSLYSMVDLVTAALLDLSAQGSGAIGFFQGFTNAGTGTIAVLRGIVGLVSALPPQITQMAGSWTAASMIAGKFGIDAGKGFEGLGAKVKAAEGASGKFKTAVGGLAAGAINPAFLAVAALGFGLDVLGQKQQQAAQRTAEHAENVRGLTQAFREDSGVIGAHVRQWNLETLQSKNASNNLSVYGQNLGTAKLAIEGNATARDRLNEAADANIARIGKEVGYSKENVGVLQQMSHQLLDTGGSYETLNGQHESYYAGLYSGTELVEHATEAQREQFKAIYNAQGAVGEQIRSQRDAQDAYRQAEAALSGLNEQELRVWELTANLSPAMYSAKAAANDLATAFNALNVEGGDVAAKGKAIIDVMLRMAGQVPTVEEALQKWNDDLRGIKESFEKLDVKKHAAELVDSAGAINTVTEAGSKLQNTVQTGATDMATFAQSLKDAGVPAGEITNRLKGMRGEFADQLHQLGLNDVQIGKVLDHYGLIPDKIVTQLGLEGDTETQAQLTDITRQLKAVPEEKGVHVNALTESAQKNLTDLGYNIVKLPDGTFQVYSNTAAAKKAADDEIARVNGLTGYATMYVNTAPAGQAVIDWKNVTDNTVGNTRTQTDIDPATGQVRLWQTTTDATGAKTTTYSNVDPATGSVRTWKLNADGTWAKMTAYADASPAERAILDVANKSYRATINVGVNYSEKISPKAGIGGGYGGRAMVADGGFVSKAPIRKYAGGGVVDIRGGGLMYGPGSGTSDSIFTWTSSGPAAMSKGEYVTPEKRVTPKTLPILEAIRDGRLRGYANGGMVQTEDGGWVPESFYGPAPKGPHAIYTDSGFAKLRAEATANGIGSLSQKDQDQLRTYGGWKDPVSQAIASGASRGGGGYSGGRAAGAEFRFLFGRGTGQLEQALIAWLQETVRKRGGNVQKVFT